MVNTFLVSSDFTQSAQLLDQKRLPNQRREAFQILCHVQRIKAIGDLLVIPLPTDPYLWYNWVRQVVKDYQQWSLSHHLQLVRINGQWTTAQLDYNVGQNDLTIRFGYIYHPAVLMWLGYEESLKMYLNAHILVSIERGIKNKMDTYEIHVDTVRPPWTHDPNFITRHRAVLLKKELDRHETPWYQLKPEFMIIPTSFIYYWPFTPKIGQSAKTHGEADLTQIYKTEPVRFTFKLKSKI
jgi:hypothetical protein